MNVIDCINARRSGRIYTDESISRATMQKLIELGTKAATGSGMQPWGFVVIQNKDEIARMSDEIKVFILAHLDEYPYFKQYEKWMINPKFNAFNRAETVLVIYGDPASHWYVYDCTLAASNIMLAAWDMGIGTCWIGFAHQYMNTSEFKAKYNVPENFELVCPMSMGYLKNPLDPGERKPPVVFNW